MSRKNALVAGGILLGAVALSVVLVLLRPEPPRAEAPSRVPMVGVAPVEAVGGPLTVTGSGTVRPRAAVDLAPQVGGRVVHVSPSLVSGGRVRAGEVLVRVEEADYRNAVEQARAQVEQDEVQVLQTEEEARIALDEYRQFLRRRGASGGSTTGVGGAEAEPPNPLVLREPQLDAARASLDRARSRLADAELQLSRTRITAPFDGVVRTETVDVGSYVSPGQTMASLYATDLVELVVPLADEEAALLPGLWSLSAGTPSEALPARVIGTYGRSRFAWEGYVDRAEAALDEESRTLDVVVRIPRPFEGGVPLDTAAPDDVAPPLLVGQFADVEIQGRTGDFVSLPRRALRTGDEVWVVDDDGTVRIVPVRVVERDDARVYLSAELEPGERVIVEGVDVVTEGMEVRLRDEVDR